MKIWRHSRRDAILLAVSATQLGVNVWLAATWTEHGWLELAGLWPVGALLFWYNAVVVTHNFIHTPWFTSAAANRLYAALSSINLGVPLTLCRSHHLNHHRYSNDRRGVDGRTRDHSSTYRFGKGGAPEGALSYGLRGLFRSGTVEAWGEAFAARRGRLLGELAVCALGVAGYAALSWRFVVWFLVPAFSAGSYLGILTNYYQHAGAEPGNRTANSVSHYGRLYNLLCFNEGYHQEHHVRPGLHWTYRPALRDTLAGSARTISSVPPLLGFLAALAGAKRTQPPCGSPPSIGISRSSIIRRI